MITKIKNATIITNKLLKGTSLYMDNGIITDITEQPLPFDCELNAEGLYLSAGFIDIHTHGAGGYDFSDGTVEDILLAAKVHATHGTTAIFPTSTTGTFEDILRFIDNVRKAMDENAVGKPFIAGAHLEGPYFSISQRGAQSSEHIRLPNSEEYHAFINRGKGAVKRMSFAPELEGAQELFTYLKENSIVSSYGHTDAVYEQLKPFIKNGCTLATHLYSGMNTVVRQDLFRKLGGVETAFLEDSVTAEIIADGLHLPPELLKLIYKIKGPDRLCLITDSMRGAGIGEGPSILGPKDNGQPCIIKNGIAYLPDFSSFCGSVATTDQLVRVMYHKAGVKLVDCIKMITSTPARIMGLKKRGRLKKGYIADLVLFDENINVHKVFMQGKEF